MINSKSFEIEKQHEENIEKMRCDHEERMKELTCEKKWKSKEKKTISESMMYY